jgi:3-oxoacyl-[acyl-carrier-protein] synthase II
MISSGIAVRGHRRERDHPQGDGPRRVSPFFIPGRIINLAAGYVSIEFGLKGLNHAVVACSTAHAIGDADR